MTTTPATVEHAITIDTVHLPARNPLQASCLCGWQSTVLASRPQAIAAGDWHLGANGHLLVPDAQPLVECKPWCQYQDGHPNCQFHEDQWCGSEILRVDLSLHEPLEDSVYDSDTHTWQPGPEYAEVYLMQHPDQDVPSFHITRSGDRPTELTPGEARHLIEALQLVLGQARQAQR